LVNPHPQFRNPQRKIGPNRECRTANRILQGYWTHAAGAPRKLGSKEFYTDQEMAGERERERDDQALQQAGTPEIITISASSGWTGRNRKLCAAPEPR
jgi:hypothetical protein